MAETRRSRRGSSAGALTRLTAVSRALTYAVSLDEVLEITVDCAVDLLDAERVVLMMLEDDGLLRIRAQRGVEPEVAERFREPLDESLIGRLSGVFGPTAAGSFLGVPLVVRGSVMGLLATVIRESGSPTERDEWLLSALADQASVALESTRDDEARPRLKGGASEVEVMGGHRDDALRMVGHDLKSPLSALNGYLHLLATESYGPLNDAQRATVERLSSITAHVASMVDSIVDIGRLASGSLHLDCGPLKLAPVVSEAMMVLGMSPQEAGVGIEVRVPEGLAVNGHRDRLRQVLVHLMDNAVKHAPRDTDVTVTAEEDGEQVAVRVHDRGPGVPPERAEEIFEPYRRLDGETAAGMGLGLAIARGLVERMGGTITVDTAATEGATFVIRLPRTARAER